MVEKLSESLRFALSEATARNFKRELERLIKVEKYLMKLTTKQEREDAILFCQRRLTP